MIKQLEFLKQIVSILMGLSITYTVQSFLEKYIHTKSGANLQQYLIFILLLLNIIRFYYGNWMYISTEFDSEPKYQQKSSLFLITFFIFIIQSIIFSMLSLQKYDNFFYFFASVLFVDALGFSILASFKETNKGEKDIERMWTWNNTVTVVLLLLGFLLFKDKNDSDSFFRYCFFISSANTFFGCYLSWKKFFY